MKVGLFLDVDGVLTVKAINIAIAEALDVQSEFRPLEKAFADGLVSSDEFGARMCQLFRGKGFNRNWIRDNWSLMPLRANFRELLKIPVATYLVSSGPSYFIEELMRRERIESDRCLFSVYEFDEGGLVERCSRPVTGLIKSEFVKQRAQSFDITVGVGDNPIVDAQFLAQCTLKIILSSPDIARTNVSTNPGLATLMEFLSVPSIGAIVDLVNRLASVGSALSIPVPEIREAVGDFKMINMSPNVFIITPFRKDIRLTNAVLTIKHELLARGIKGWTADDLELRPELWENVRCFMHACDAAVALFVPDMVMTKKASKPNWDVIGVSPNVSIEVGYMLSLRRPVLLLKDSRLPKLPADIGGLLYEDLDIADSAESSRRAIQGWLQRTRLFRNTPMP